jgi:hypothetical protein
VNEWPDFFIVGAAKSGTTSLYYYLREHPSIFMPELKEPRFFTFYGEESVNIPPRFQVKVVTNKDEYFSLFKEAKNSQLKGEASTMYLFLYQNTIQNMSNLIADFSQRKIIIILRNPIERAFSHYRMYLLARHENEIFSNAIQNDRRSKLIEQWSFYDYISPGFYSQQVQAYMNEFNKVFICLYEDLKYNPQELMKNLYDFLNIDSSFIPNYQKIYNEGGANKIYTGVKGILRRAKHSTEAKLGKRTLYPYPYQNEEEMYQDYVSIYPYVYSIFEKDIIDLQSLLSRDLSAWKKFPSSK